jgi:hypothetical protein
MKLTKAQFKAADTLLTEWRLQSVPSVITMSEAFYLTSGLVGVPYSHKKQAEAISLSAVAVKTVKAIQKTKSNN